MIGRHRRTAARGILFAVLLGTGFTLGPAYRAAAAEKKENLAIFEVRVEGKPAKIWTRSQIRKLPGAEFTNRQGKKRTAVLLSTLLEASGVPVDRVATVTVAGLGGDSEKGPSTKNVKGEKGPGQTSREFRGDDLGSALARAAVFYNADQFWTLADVDAAGRGMAPWNQNRVRKVRRIDVAFK